MNKIRTAVVGVGYLGKYHAEKLALLPHSQLVAVCDIDHERCLEQAQKYRVKAVSDYRSLIGSIDAVSIAVPTSLHHEVGLFFLNNGVHVLLEKPIATTLVEADELISAAKHHQVVLQIGHLERFNNALKAVEPFLSNPRFIESLRLAPFKLRGTDVNVILDLMIHDIDIILSIVKSRTCRIAANGAAILSSYIDIANARIEFDNGCVANVTASRVSWKTERKLRIFQHDSYISIDLDHKKISIYKKVMPHHSPHPEIVREELSFDHGDALKAQIETFLWAIHTQTNPVVTGEDGKRALATALEITQIVHTDNEVAHATAH